MLKHTHIHTSIHTSTQSHNHSAQKAHNKDAVAQEKPTDMAAMASVCLVRHPEPAKLRH